MMKSAKQQNWTAAAATAKNVNNQLKQQQQQQAEALASNNKANGNANTNKRQHKNICKNREIREKRKKAVNINLFDCIDEAMICVNLNLNNNKLIELSAVLTTILKTLNSLLIMLSYYFLYNSSNNAKNENKLKICKSV